MINAHHLSLTCAKLDLVQLIKMNVLHSMDVLMKILLNVIKLVLVLKLMINVNKFINQLNFLMDVL